MFDYRVLHENNCVPYVYGMVIIFLCNIQSGPNRNASAPDPLVTRTKLNIFIIEKCFSNVIECIN